MVKKIIELDLSSEKRLQNIQVKTNSKSQAATIRLSLLIAEQVVA